MTSMSSISSSVLFSSVGWSAMASSSASTLSCSQSIPIDIRHTESECGSTEPDAYWDFILDQTTLDLGFDVECLDGLDDVLLLSPTDAFATVCWDTAIQIPLPRPRPIPRPFLKSLAGPAQKSRPRPLPMIPEASPSPSSSVPFPRRRPVPLIITTSGTSSEEEEEEYESDSDDLTTLRDDGVSTPSPPPSPLSISSLPPSPSSFSSPYDTGFHLNHQPMVEPIRLIKYSCLPYEIDEIDSSYILFEPQHTSPYDYDNSFTFSPFHDEPRKQTKVDRIAAFCANLPTRLLRASTW